MRQYLRLFVVTTRQNAGKKNEFPDSHIHSSLIPSPHSAPDICMWIQRTPDEIVKWQESTCREARSHGRLMSGLVLFLFPSLLAGGWVISIRAGAAIQQSGSGNFWQRLPIFIAAAIPFAFFVYRREKRRELASLRARTICPTCDIAAQGNEGATCQCGGAFVSLGTVKWVEEDNANQLPEEPRDFITNLAKSEIWILAVGLRGAPSIPNIHDPSALDTFAAHRIDVSEMGDDDSIHPFNYELDGKQVLPFFSSEERAKEFLSSSAIPKDVFQPCNFIAGFIATPENDMFELVLDPHSPGERKLNRQERLLLRSISTPV